MDTCQLIGADVELREICQPSKHGNVAYCMRFVIEGLRLMTLGRLTNGTFQLILTEIQASEVGQIAEAGGDAS